MYFIFRHSEKSSYKNKIGEFYHFTNKSPNYKKVKEKCKVLIYKKEINSIIGIAQVGKIRKKKMNSLQHFFVYYEKFIWLKKPLVCNEKFFKKTKMSFKLDAKLPGIIPITKQQFKSVLNLIKSKND